MDRRWDDESDGDLIERTRQGDERAFGELWRRHASAAHGMARSFGADPEEVVADAFSAVLRAIRNGKGPTDSFRAYLFASVRHSAIRMVNVQRRMSPLNSDEDAAFHNLESEYDNEPVVDTYVHEVFRSLPERWRQVLWYTEIEQFSPVETAEVMGIAPNAVSALALRARRGLRKSWISGYRAKLPTGSECRRTLDYLESRILNLDPVEYDAVHVRDCSFCETILGRSSTPFAMLATVVLPSVVGASAAVAYLAAVKEGATALGASVAMDSPYSEPARAADSSADGARSSSAAGVGKAVLAGLALVGTVAVAGILLSPVVGSTTPVASGAALDPVTHPAPTPTRSVDPWPVVTPSPAPPVSGRDTSSTEDPVAGAPVDPGPVDPGAPAPRPGVPPPAPPVAAPRESEHPAPSLSIVAGSDRVFPTLLMAGDPALTVELQYRSAGGADAPWVSLPDAAGFGVPFAVTLPPGEWDVRAVSVGAATEPCAPVRVTVAEPPVLNASLVGAQWVLSIVGAPGASVEAEAGGSVTVVVLDETGGHSYSASESPVRARYVVGESVGPWSASVVREL